MQLETACFVLYQVVPSFGSMTSTRPISIVLLAAGLGQRMPSLKPLLPFRGKPMISHALENVISQPVAERILVTGHEATSIYQLVQGLPVWVIYNKDYLDGLGSSLAAGIRQASLKTRGYLIWLADMPLLESLPVLHLIDEFLTRMESGQPVICRPVYDQQPGHPVLFSAHFRKELSVLTGDEGARDIIRRNRHALINIPWHNSSCLVDLDTPEDIRSWDLQ